MYKTQDDVLFTQILVRNRKMEEDLGIPNSEWVDFGMSMDRELVIGFRRAIPTEDDIFEDAVVIEGPTGDAILNMTFEEFSKVFPTFKKIF